MNASNNHDSITSIGEHAAHAIARAHSAFQQAKITGAYGNALLMNYAELKAIIGRFEGLVCGIAGDIGYPCNLTERVVPTEVKPVIEPEAESLRDELLKAAEQVDNAIDAGETVLLAGVAKTLRYAASAPGIKRPRDTENDNRKIAYEIRRHISSLPTDIMDDEASYLVSAAYSALSALAVTLERGLAL